MVVLKGHKTSIQLNENSTSYFESHKLPIHLLHLVVAKLVKEGILEHVPPGSSKWASLIVIL